MSKQLHHHPKNAARAQQLQRALKTQGIDTECKPYPPSISGSDQQTLLCFSLSLWHDPDWAEARHQEYAAHIYLDDTPLNPQQHSAEHYFDLHDWQPGLENSEFQRLVGYLQKQQSTNLTEAPVAKGSLLRRLIAIGASALTGLGIFYTLVSGQNAVSAALCEVPGVTGICVSQGWGGHPTPDQEVEYQNAIAGGCDGLRQFTNEKGHHKTHVAKALLRLQSAKKVHVDHWTETTESLTLHQSPGVLNHVTEAAAHKFTLNNAKDKAKQDCINYARYLRAQYISHDSVITKWDCRQHAHNTWDCSATGTTECQIKLHEFIQIEQCTAPDDLAES